MKVLAPPKELPIQFKAEMVKAILEDRKTQTRRIVVPQPSSGVRSTPLQPSGFEDGHGRQIKLKYCVGDRLWVRENFCTCYNGPEAYQIIYAGGDRRDFSTAMNTTDDQLDWLEHSMDVHGEGGRPSIHLPRWGSRLMLDVHEVRLQRLQEITEEDARAEGAEPMLTTPYPQGFKNGFQELWDSINGKREGCSWKSDPWVWVVKFKRIR